MARIIIAVGLVIVLIGLVLAVAPRALSWFGQLPGDLRIERGEFTLWLPITSMIVLSLAATALINLALWLIDRFG